MNFATPGSGESSDPIARLEARMARIESAVLRMSEVIEQLPDLVAMAGDVADSEVARLASRGVDVDARIRQALQLTERITRPEALSALERMTDQAVRMEDTVGMMLDIADEYSDRLGAQTGHSAHDRVHALMGLAVRASQPTTLRNLERMLDLADSAEGNLGMVLDIADDFVAGLATGEQDAHQRVQELARLAQRLTEPSAVRLAHKVLDKSDNLEQLMDVALSAPDTVGMLMDTLDELMAQAGEQGIDLADVLPQLTRAAVRLVQIAGSDKMMALIDSYVLEPDALDVVGQAASALVATRQGPVGKAGLFKAMSALSDPQVQAALDFAIRFGRHFGASVQDPRQLPQRP